MKMLRRKMKMKKEIQRKASLSRKTKETDISLTVNLDGSGQVNIQTGLGMLDHLLTLTAFWANFDLDIKCSGDLHIDGHHTAEDVALCLGNAMVEALGDRKGITRVGYGRVPMDEALADVTLDISGRTWLEWRNDELLPPMIGGEEADLWREHYKALASALRCNLHINFHYGKNGHHLLESVAKGLGLALAQAVSIQGDMIRSTKGGLD